MYVVHIKTVKVQLCRMSYTKNTQSDTNRQTVTEPLHNFTLLVAGGATRQKNRRQEPCSGGEEGKRGERRRRQLEDQWKASGGASELMAPSSELKWCQNSLVEGSTVLYCPSIRLSIRLSIHPSISPASSITRGNRTSGRLELPPAATGAT